MFVDTPGCFLAPSLEVKRVCSINKFAFFCSLYNLIDVRFSYESSFQLFKVIVLGYRNISARLETKYYDKNTCQGKGLGKKNTKSRIGCLLGASKRKSGPEVYFSIEKS